MWPLATSAILKQNSFETSVKLRKKYIYKTDIKLLPTTPMFTRNDYAFFEFSYFSYLIGPLHREDFFDHNSFINNYIL